VRHRRRDCAGRERSGRYTGIERGSGRDVRVPVPVRVRVAVRVCTHQIRLQPPPNHFSVLAKPHGPLESARRACTIPVEREHRRPCRRTVVKERLSSTRGMISHVEGWGALSTPRALRCRSRVYAWIRCVPSQNRSMSTRACSRVRDFGVRSGRVSGGYARRGCSCGRVCNATIISQLVVRQWGHRRRW
jgi:hypothetical protein